MVCYTKDRSAHSLTRPQLLHQVAALANLTPTTDRQDILLDARTSTPRLQIDPSVLDFIPLGATAAVRDGAGDPSSEGGPAGAPAPSPSPPPSLTAQLWVESTPVRTPGTAAALALALALQVP